jgi:hypothetical protein
MTILRDRRASLEGKTRMGTGPSQLPADLLPNELRAFWADRRAFISEEIRYSKLMCRDLARQRDTHYLYGLRLFDQLDGIVARASATAGSPTEADPDRLILWALMEEIHECLPPLLGNFAFTHVSRRRKGPRQTDGSLRYALSEVHPEYPGTIRVIEILNYEYYHAVKPFYENRKTIPPLLAIGSASRFIHNPFPISKNNEVLYPKDAPARDYTTDVINFSWISLPRWAPIQIRFLPALAHEAAHTITHLLNDAHEQCANLLAAGKSDLLTDQLRREYGSPVVELFHMTLDLLNDLTHLYYTLRSGNRRLRSQIRDRLLVRPRRSYPASDAEAAADCLGEFVADIVALVVAGPSMIACLPVAAFPVYHGLKRLADPERSSIHPPTASRLDLLMGLWRTIDKGGGFTTGLGNCLDAYRTTACVGTADDEGVQRVFDEFIAKHFRAFEGIFKWLLALLPGSTCARVLDDRFVWTHKRLVECIDQVMTGNPLQANVHLLELPNLIWYKRMHCPGLPNAREPWRIAALSAFNSRRFQNGAS